LRAEGVHVFSEREDGDYGKFGWILDIEGNKIELWEPVE
jgi:D-3-phosphoglycerate dehydrogenase